MKWIFYVIVFIYMFYRAVYGAKSNEIGNLSIEPVEYDTDKNFLEPGVRKTITCKGANKNQKVEWLDPAGKTVRRVPTNRVFVQEHLVPSPRNRIPALMLVFTSVSVEDGGVWQCRAGSEIQNVSLCVIDPSQFVDTPTEIAVDNGRSITLSCQTRGDPEPRVVWYGNGEMITDETDISKYQVMTKYNSQGFEGLLTITYLNPDDSGIYTCEAFQETHYADDCSYKQSLNITLHVNHAPMFKHGNDTITVYGSEGKSVQLVCSASAYPTPTYRWFKEIGDTLSEFAREKIQLLEGGTQAALTLIADESTLGEIYKCRATNQYGDADKSFLLLKPEKPKKPSQIAVRDVTDNEISLQVIWYDVISFPVDDIDVQYLKRENMKLKVPREQDWRKSEIVQLKPEELVFDSLENDIKGPFVILSDLEEDTEYWVRLRAVNSVGYSPWSKPIVAATDAKLDVTEEPEETEGTTSEPLAAQVYSDSTFYGIFFAGGILVVAVGCMFAMRFV